MPDQSSDRYSFLYDYIRLRKQSERYRDVRVIENDLDPAFIHIDGRRLLNTCSNDYLNLSRNPSVCDAVSTAAIECGHGSTASRLVAGTFGVHAQFEKEYADFTGRESSILFPSGFQTNIAVLSVLGDRETTFFIDKLAHHSLIQGARLSHGNIARFQHNDTGHLETLLKRSKPGRKIVVTESIFSMDGDACDLPELCRLCDNYDAFLYVDEAHSLGVLGSEGRGVCYGVDRVDVVGGMFGKTFGGMGGSVAGKHILTEYLRNASGGFIYTTAPALPLVAGLTAAMNTLKTMNAERDHLHRQAQLLRDMLHNQGFDTLQSTSQIIPVRIGSEADTLDAAAHLFSEGILAAAIRPPTVPEGQSRLRITLTAAHTARHVHSIVDALIRWKSR